MGEIISRSQFAGRLGISASNVTRAVQKGKIASVDGNIDLDDPTVQAFMHFHKTHRKASGHTGQGRPVMRDAPVVDAEAAAGAPVSAFAPPPYPPGVLDAHDKGKELDAKLKQVKLATKKLDYGERTKQLSAVDHITRTLGVLKAVLDENFRSFASRNSSELFELARAVNESAWAERLTTRIDESLDASLEAVDREIKKYRDEFLR